MDGREAKEILGNLNDAQRDAASHGDDPLLIIAGAGSGKTTTLVHRVAYLIDQGVPPQCILLLTFTRRASSEMLRRVQGVLPPNHDGQRVWGGTFHAVGSRLLRIYGQAIGVHPRFTIHDRGDSEDLMRALVTELGLGKEDKKFPKKGTCMAIHSFCVNSGKTLTQALDSNFSGQNDRAEPLARLFEAYTRRKRELNVFDYDDLLLSWRDLLDEPQAGERIRERFDCVLVDEYQDTNPLQAGLLGRLCPHGKGLTVVGDDAQSIYSFRAATVRNILDFPKQFPNTRVVKLEQNYRSTQLLLGASNGVISEAREGYTKKLWSARDGGPPPQLVNCYDQDEQSEFVVRRILEHHRAGVPFCEQAVLFRASHHSIALETELAANSITFVKYGGLKFVESAHVKDLLSLLRLAENPRDIVAGTRALPLLPGVGPKKSLQLMQVLADADGRFQAWADVKPPAKAANAWPAFVAMMQHLADDPDRDVAGQIECALDFYAPILEEKYDNAPARLSDLDQLQQIALKYSDRSELLADLTIDPPTSKADLPQTPEDRDDLVLSTMHSAKGLEWQAVYVLHASEGMIPLERSFGDVEQLEEERRMLYVALTRAADWLYVCYTQNHWERSRGGWSDWDGDGFRELTRFLPPRSQQAFQCQIASEFQMVEQKQPSPAKSGGKKRRRKSRARR